MTLDTTVTGQTVGHYGTDTLLIEHDTSMAEDYILFDNSFAVAHFHEAPAVDLTTAGDMVLTHPFGVSGRPQAGDALWHRMLERWLTASIPMSNLSDWDPLNLKIDPSMAFTLPRGIQLFVAHHEGQPIGPGLGDSSRTPKSESLGARLTAADKAQRGRLARRLSLAFDTEPIEDGWTHPAEDIIADALSNPRAAAWLTEFCVGPTRTDDGASVMRNVCASTRSSQGPPLANTTACVRRWLPMTSNCRDAAVQAAEADRASTENS